MPRRTPIPLLLPLAAAIGVTVPFDSAQATTGDMNCCGGVTGDDVDFFVTALIDPMGYADLFPACDVILADMNGNGLEDGNDIPMFVTKLLAAPPIPLYSLLRTAYACPPTGRSARWGKSCRLLATIQAITRQVNRMGKAAGGGGMRIVRGTS